MHMYLTGNRNEIKLVEGYYRFYKSRNDAFTIIELLIVIIVIGILSALSLPSFMNQASKAKQSEARTYIGSMNRAQQAEYMERGRFTGELGTLGLGIVPETAAYIYRIESGSVTGPNIVNRAIPSDGNFNDAPGNQATVSAYIGGVKVGSFSEEVRSASTLVVLCEALEPPVADGNNGEETEPLNLSSESVGAPTCDTTLYRALK